MRKIASPPPQKPHQIFFIKSIKTSKVRVFFYRHKRFEPIYYFFNLIAHGIFCLNISESKRFCNIVYLSLDFTIGNSEKARSRE